MAILLFLENQKEYNEKTCLLLNELKQNRVKVKAILDCNASLRTGIAIAQPHIRNVWKFYRSGKFWEHDIPAMDEARFKENFRLDRSTFQKLCEKVKKYR